MSAKRSLVGMIQTELPKRSSKDSLAKDKFMDRDASDHHGEIYKLTIPEEIYGTVIDGIDLQILSSDSVRIIEAYIVQEGELSEIQQRILRQCEYELAAVILKTDVKVKIYFSKLHSGITDVIRKLTITGSS